MVGPGPSLAVLQWGREVLLVQLPYPEQINTAMYLILGIHSRVEDMRSYLYS